MLLPFSDHVIGRKSMYVWYGSVFSKLRVHPPFWSQARYLLTSGYPWVYYYYFWNVWGFSLAYWDSETYLQKASLSHVFPVHSIILVLIKMAQKWWGHGCTRCFRSRLTKVSECAFATALKSGGAKGGNQLHFIGLFEPYILQVHYKNKDFTSYRESGDITSVYSKQNRGRCANNRAWYSKWHIRTIKAQRNTTQHMWVHLGHHAHARTW